MPYLSIFYSGHHDSGPQQLFSYPEAWLKIVDSKTVKQKDRKTFLFSFVLKFQSSSKGKKSEKK